MKQDGGSHSQSQVERSFEPCCATLQAATAEAEAKVPLPLLSTEAAQPQQQQDAELSGPGTPPQLTPRQCRVDCGSEPQPEGAHCSDYDIFPEGSPLREAYALARRGLLEHHKTPAEMGIPADVIAEMNAAMAASGMVGRRRRRRR